ncbi:MAG: histidine--tRNA ligase [Bacilli bacterium]|nr:histidine--tRNA ligase [Bacilli bacterium]
MEIKNVKGGYDFLPNEQRIRNYIMDVLKDTFAKYGYGPIETPILCYYDILVDKYDENNDIVNEIYKLKDQGNRSLGLRYDLTVPFAKCIALNKNLIRFPFKRYEISKVFRDGPVKVGRDREFTQCDVDVVGVDGEQIEAELLCLYVDAFSKLEINVMIKYNNRKLMKGLLLVSGVGEEILSETITIVDKINKISKEEFENNLINLGIEKNNIELIFNYFSMSLKELCKTFEASDNKLINEGLLELTELENYIDKLGLNDSCVFTSSLARGQEYYTGNVFEVYDKELRVTSSIGGGGRYDKMITEFINDGEKYPAVGISFGLTCIYEILKNKSELKDSAGIDIFIIPMGTKVESLSLAREFRKLGYRVDIDMSGKKIKNSMSYANREMIPYVIVLGENEISSNLFKVKDMFNNKEIEMKLDNVEKIRE